MSILNNPQAVRLHEESISGDNCSEVMRGGPLSPTIPNASPMRIASWSMIYPISSLREIAYLQNSVTTPP